MSAKQLGDQGWDLAAGWKGWGAEVGLPSFSDTHVDGRGAISCCNLCSLHKMLQLGYSMAFSRRTSLRSRSGFQALLERNAKVKVVNKRGLTPLGEAVAAGHAECAAALKASGADVRHRPSGFTLLHVAAGLGQEATLQWLLEWGADVDDAANAEGYSPLHSAALGGSAACVRLLLEAGAKPDATGADGATPAALVNQRAKGGKELLEVLGGKAALKRAAGTAAVHTAASPSAAGRAADAVQDAGPAGAFLAMTEPDQLRRVRRWAEAPTVPADEFRQVLDSFQPEVRARVAEARKLLQLITIHKARDSLRPTVSC